MGIITKELQINEDIRLGSNKQVRVIDDNGDQLGILTLSEAQSRAYDKGLDLALIAPQGDPPVCRILDYGKYRFEMNKKDKEAKKKQQTIEVKEIQLSCRIDTNDFNTKLNQARKFLQSGNKVKVNIRFKGREMSHVELGKNLLDKFEAECKDYGTVDKRPVLEGRFMNIMIQPLSAKQLAAKAASRES